MAEGYVGCFVTRTKLFVNVSSSSQCGAARHTSLMTVGTTRRAEVGLSIGALR